jgi:hypothetical protein
MYFIVISAIRTLCSKYGCEKKNPITKGAFWMIKQAVNPINIER